jgi:hypothetical protein
MDSITSFIAIRKIYTECESTEVLNRRTILRSDRLTSGKHDHEI